MYLSYHLMLLAASQSACAIPIYTGNPLSIALRWYQEGRPVSLIHKRNPNPLTITFEDSSGKPFATVDQTATPAQQTVVTTTTTIAFSSAAANGTSSDTTSVEATSVSSQASSNGIAASLAVSSNVGGMVGSVPAVGNNPGSSPSPTQSPEITSSGAQSLISTATSNQGPFSSSLPAASDNSGASQDVTTLFTTRLVTITVPRILSTTSAASSASQAPTIVVPQISSSAFAAISNAPDVLQQPSPATTSNSGPSNGDTFPLVTPTSSTAQARSSSTQQTFSSIGSQVPNSRVSSTLTFVIGSASAASSLSTAPDSASATDSESGIPVPTVFTITPPAIVTTITIAPPNATKVSIPPAAASNLSSASASASETKSTSPSGLDIVPIGSASVVQSTVGATNTDSNAITVTTTVYKHHRTFTVMGHTTTVTKSL
ncbi:uncharacterized protein PV09_03624 [Verruconis gallopava]|uniref:Ig-like domain-containing protein n=1 Tax=Verruconis gallopava TaxID=253628 RepID=A0A0D2AFL5_9PEZI|nr:uncharacterized protein PV09_03624 [Verruconis gallopava]KIW05768.1 hypothetical protein PV09_03624 [Verruconis gallopava]